MEDCLHLIIKCVFHQLGTKYGTSPGKTKLNISSSILTSTKPNIALIDDTVQLGRSKRTILNNSSRGEFYFWNCLTDCGHSKQMNFLFVANVVFRCYHFSKQFLSKPIKDWIFGFFHNILLCYKSCKNGYSDNQHCLPKVWPI